MSEARLRAFKKERRVRRGPPLSFLRLSELRKVVAFWRDNGLVETPELSRNVFAIAVPELLRRPFVSTKEAGPCGRSFSEFAAEWCPAHYDAMGGSAYFNDLQAHLEATPKSRWPLPRSPDRAAQLLDLTDDIRAELDIRTIGAVDRDKAQRLADRKRRNRERKAEVRREKNMTPRAESLSRTKPWLAAGVSRRTWYRNRANGQAGTDLSAPGTKPSAPVAQICHQSPKGFLKTPHADETVPRSEDAAVGPEPDEAEPSPAAVHAPQPPPVLRLPPSRPPMPRLGLIDEQWSIRPGVGMLAKAAQRAKGSQPSTSVTGSAAQTSFGLASNRVLARAAAANPQPYALRLRCRHDAGGSRQPFLSPSQTVCDGLRASRKSANQHVERSALGAL